MEDTENIYGASESQIILLAIHTPIMILYTIFCIFYILIFIVYFKLIMTMLLFITCLKFLTHKFMNNSPILDNPIYEFILAIILSSIFIYITKFAYYNFIFNFFDFSNICL